MGSFEKTLRLLATHGPESGRAKARRALEEYQDMKRESDLRHERILALAETLDDEGREELRKLVLEALEKEADALRAEWAKKRRGK